MHACARTYHIIIAQKRLFRNTQTGEFDIFGKGVLNCLHFRAVRGDASRENTAAAWGGLDLAPPVPSQMTAYPARPWGSVEYFRQIVKK
jgi:hypothetical protein